MGKTFSKNKKSKATPEASVLYVFGQNTSSSNFMLTFDQAKGELLRKEVPKGPTFFNYSGIVMKNNETLIVCGGINHGLNNITKKCYELNLKTFKATNLPDMQMERYTFPVVCKGQKVFVIGGRQYGGDDVSLLSHCEALDLGSSNRNWSPIAPMNKPRCTSSCFLYRNQIWVVGGYSGPTKRTKKVERYLEESNQWEIVHFRLSAGFDAANIMVSEALNQFIVFGGKYANDSSKTVLRYDIVNETVLNANKLAFSNLITKCVRLDNGGYLNVGYDKNPFFQYYDPKTNVLTQDRAKIVSLDGLVDFKQYNFNQKVTMVPGPPNPTSGPRVLALGASSSDNLMLGGRLEPDIPLFNDHNAAQRNPSELGAKSYQTKTLIFGTDEEPFQIEIDMLSGSIETFGISTRLRLQNFQGICRLSADKLMFSGGININFNRISCACYEYDLRTRQVRQLDGMKSSRYTFPLIMFGDYVYAIGGREYGNDQVGIYRSCERYNLKSSLWEWAPELQTPRCTSNTFALGGRLYVMGGYTPKVYRTNTIEVLNEKKQRWEVMGVLLQEAVEAVVLLQTHDSIFYCSGRTNKGDVMDKYVLHFGHGDFDSVERYPEVCKTKACLNKAVRFQKHYIIFGGFKFSEEQNYEIIDGNTFASLKLDGSTELKGLFTDFNTRLREHTEAVCYSDHFLKRHSSVLPWLN